MNDTALIIRAAAFAAHKHRNQRRKDADESSPIEPWYKDPEKLINAALNEDHDRRKALIGGLIELANNNNEFRLYVLGEFKYIGKGKKGQRLSRPRYIDEMIFDHVNFLFETGKVRSKDKAIEQAAIHFIRSESSVRSIYFAVKKREPIKVQTHNICLY